MARIGTYNLDESIDGSEKLIGSDVTGSVTRNFTIDDIAGWLNSHAVIGIAGQTSFNFQATEGEGLLNGTVSLPNFSGSTSFDQVTSLVFSAQNARNLDISPYLSSLVDEVVILFRMDNIGQFGVYTLNDFVQSEDPNFYNASLTHEQSNGSLEDGVSYGFAIYPSASVEPTRTLDDVTDAGNTTTNSIEVGGLTVTTPIKNYNPNIPDIGAKQDNDLRGYGDGYISDKTLAFVRLSEQAKEEEGAVRIKQGAFQAYINGGWQTVVSNFRFREDANGGYELEHKPVGFEWWIEVNSGNSDLLGLNGLPLVQQYKVSMGAYPVPLQLDGGTF